MKKLTLTFLLLISCLVLIGCTKSSKKDSVTNSLDESSSTVPTELTTTVDEKATVSLDTDTDYDKVEWGVSYELLEDEPGLKASVTLFQDNDDTYYLIVGITNYYSEPVSVSAKAFAKGSDDKFIGKSNVSFDTIGPANTCIFTIKCDKSEDVPSGKIRWKDLKIKKSKHEYIPWEADWKIDVKDGLNLTLDCDLIIDGSKPNKIDDFCALALDDSGIVVGIFDQFKYTKSKNNIIANMSLKDLTNNPVDVAIFVNPTK